MKLFLYLILMLGFTVNSYAANIRLQRPSISGNGCLPGTFTAAISEDKSAITIVFSDFIAEAGRLAGRIFEIKQCNMILPVIIPSGYKISFVDVDIQGYFSIPKGGKGGLKTRYLIAGHLPFEDEKNFVGPYDDDFIFTSKLKEGVWSHCGGGMHLNMNTTLNVWANTQMEGAVAGVDSFDLGGAVEFKYKIERCRIGF